MKRAAEVSNATGTKNQRVEKSCAVSRAPQLALDLLAELRVDILRSGRLLLEGDLLVGSARLAGSGRLAVLGRCIAVLLGGGALFATAATLVLVSGVLVVGVRVRLGAWLRLRIVVVVVLAAEGEGLAFGRAAHLLLHTCSSV